MLCFEGYKQFLIKKVNVITEFYNRKNGCYKK